LPAKEPIVIDGTGHLLGRTASIVAKKLILGERVVIVNGDRLVISGDPDYQVETFAAKLEIKTIHSPRNTPHHFRRPDMYVRRSVRGMLPHEKPKGRNALRLLTVYIGIPTEYAGKQPLSLPEAAASKLRTKSMTVGELLQHFGWKM
jgi:large subunit ribosomal protein L13